MRFDRPAVLHTRRGEVPLRLAVAADPWSRLCGLMFRAPLRPGPQGTPGLLLAGCTAVHGGFVREALDIAFLDDDGVVGATARLPRWGMAWAPRGRGARPARHTLELPWGSLDRLGLRPGDRLRRAAPAKPCGVRATEVGPWARG